jgi:hypothetical protein
MDFISFSSSINLYTSILEMKYFHHQGHLYRILRQVKHHNFPDKSLIKEFMETIYHCDHVLSSKTHYMFCETVQEAEVIEYL